jgi:hypothetical protein
MYFAVLVGLTWLVDRLGFWDTSLIGATVFWFLFTGFKYFLQSSDAGKRPGFFRERALEAIGLAALFEFFVNIRTFTLLVELILLPVLVVLAMLQAFCGMKTEYEGAKRVVTVMLAGITMWLVVSTVIGIVDHRSDLDAHQLIASFVLPVWLTAGALPYIYVLALFAGYEAMFGRTSHPGRASWWVRLGVIAAFRGRLRPIDRYSGYLARQANEAGSLVGAYRAANGFKAELREQEAAERAYQKALRTNAGLDGDDEAGRRLDKREFRETCEALRWLATCQMGWYRRDGANRYREDMLRILGNFERQGLPPEHGITMRVSPDGQAWAARRTTVSGWVFGIGASDAPPSQWLFDGEKAPTGCPGRDRSWGTSASDQHSLNWTDDA